MAPHTPLASFPIVHTTDPDEAQALLSRELVDVSVTKVKDRHRFHLEMNGVHLGKTSLGYNRFNTDTSIDAGQVNDAIILVVGIGPPSVISIDDDQIVCTDRGAVISPSRRIINERPVGGGVYFLRAEMKTIEERFREVMGWLPRKPMVFDRSVDLRKGRGAQAHRLLNYLVDEIQLDNTILENPLLKVGFDDMVLNTLLTLPNTFSEELMGDRQLSVAPALVRRAEEFSDAYATEPITISDLVAECNCSRNVLFSAFRKFRGYTPMQFLANSRLRSAHKALQSPSPGDTVTSIAYARGFSHLGRFSDAYHRRFGESPSETLHKAEPSIDP